MSRKLNIEQLERIQQAGPAVITILNFAERELKAKKYNNAKYAVSCLKDFILNGTEYPDLFVEVKE